MPEMSVKESFVQAALAVIAHINPDRDDDGRLRVPFREAAFLASRKLFAAHWWDKLPFAERRLVASVAAIAPLELADPRVFADTARLMFGALDPDQPGDGCFLLAGEDPSRADGVYVRLGGDPLAHAQRAVRRFLRPSARPKAREFAEPGQWSVDAYDKNKGRITGKAVLAAPSEWPGVNEDAYPQVSTRPYQPEPIAPTVTELLKLAELIDGRLTEKGRKPYLHRTLDALFEHLRTVDADGHVDALALMSGKTRILKAPTGTGKSVLVRVMAAWFADQGLRLAVVVPDIKATMKLSGEIQRDLDHLHEIGRLPESERCTPLMSPHGRWDQLAKRVGAVDEDTPGVWDPRDSRDIDELAYGCALRSTTEPPDALVAGDEPCNRLGGSGGKARACYFIPVCGRWRPLYKAHESAVTVTNHPNFVSGKTGIGVRLGEHTIAGMSIREMLIRTCDAMIIDEIDSFQKNAVSTSTSDTVLASRRAWTSALQRLDRDVQYLSSADQKSVQKPISRLRDLCEALLLALVHKEISLGTQHDHHLAEIGRTQTYDGWHTANGFNRSLLAVLRPEITLVDNDGDATEVPQSALDWLDALHPYQDESEPAPSLDPLGTRIRQLLSELLDDLDEDRIGTFRLHLRSALANHLEDPHDRATAADLLIIRTFLSEISRVLPVLRTKLQRLRGHNLTSITQFLQQTNSLGVAAVLPTPAVGQSLAGYRVDGMQEAHTSAELKLQSITGDPHTYTAHLGGLVSLLTARVERPVMGLSATAYFPQAVREHVHAEIAWWMTDAHAQAVYARAQGVAYGGQHARQGQPIQIAGQHASHKPAALEELAHRLYDHESGVKTVLEDLAHSAESQDRARAILVANGYEQCAHLARGLTRNPKLTHRVCVAVRNTNPVDQSPDLPSPDRAKRLPPEQFENFHHYGEILIAPLAVIARGLNIVHDNGRSAVESIFLCVRPVLSINDLVWMHASVNASGFRALAEGSNDPQSALQAAELAARSKLATILRSSPQFSKMSKILQDEVVAGMLVDLIQLAGRARRGGTGMNLVLVDYAFQNATWRADLATVIDRIYTGWTDEEKARMRAYYGDVLEMFLTYAGVTA
ncbi:hypothetical protein ABZ644_07250 [Nocardiopsis alba]|uniref:hypothetical protein n=1 Tax=Nocardiopsis alba TaxID=53437 RepID=UPI0033F59BAE